MKSFLQTKDWAQFQEAFGRQTFWIGDKLVVKFDLPFGKSWLYASRVELKNLETKKQKNLKTKEHRNLETNDFLKELSKIAEKENAIFVKIEPDLNSKFQFTIFNQIRNSNVLIIKNLDIDLKLKIKNLKLFASNCLQPQDELVLDISQSEEKLLEQMHQKTRYNIRLAQKKGPKVEISQDPKGIDEFYKLAVKTSAHDGFKYHGKIYYQKMMEVLANSHNIKLELMMIESDNQTVASGILLYFKQTCYYLHGASDWSRRQLMAPYLMQWEAIKRAKRKGCKFYNFGGIAPQAQTEEQKNIETKEHRNIETEKQKNSTSVSQFFSFLVPKSRPAWARWSGITRFKTGFAPEGKTLHYPDCYDIVYQLALYWAYKLLKKIKN